MRIARIIHVLAVAAMVGAGGAVPTYADEMPVWPHDQQLRLRAVESEVVEVQRKLSVARRKHDLPTVEVLSAKFKTLQDERMDLIRATEHQLPID